MISWKSVWGLSSMSVVVPRHGQIGIALDAADVIAELALHHALAQMRTECEEDAAIILQDRIAPDRALSAAQSRARD